MENKLQQEINSSINCFAGKLKETGIWIFSRKKKIVELQFFVGDFT